MASARAATIKRLYDLFNRLPTDDELLAASTEVEQALDLFDPELEWVPPPIAPGMAPSYGREELRQFWLDWFSNWQEHRSDPEQIIEKGDRVLVLHLNRLRGCDGIEFETRGGAIFSFRQDKIVRGAVYMDQESARREFEVGG